ncbi:MAG TPA: ATP-binding protein [Parafilimonas sp.]|nr:ATP-binding protein [Parafilimonas sp.]
MKEFIKICFLLLIPCILQAQHNPYWENPKLEEVSRMRVEFSNDLNDTTRMYLSKQLGLFYYEANTDSSLYYLENELLIAKKLNFELWQADALCAIGYVHSLMSNYSKALSSLLAALKIAEDKTSEKKIWRISYFAKDNNPESARLLVLASTHHNLGHLYGWTRNKEKQLAEYSESLSIAEKIKDLALLSLVHMNLGNVYEHMGHSDTALSHEQTALKYSDSSGFTKYKGLILCRIGDICIKQGKYDVAKKYLLESINANEEQSVLSFLAEACVTLSNLFLMNGNLDSSFYYANEGLNASLAAGYSFETLNAYKVLSSIYSGRGKTDSAFKYQKLAFAVNDSLFTIEKNNQFQNIGFEEQNRLQELEKDKIKTEDKIRSYALLAGLGVLLIIGLILYRNNRQKQKANKVLETTLTNLKSTQAQLIQSEKMASLGELTAGIAHEIQNPLNFVNNFSELNDELIQEMKDETDVYQIKIIVNDIQQNNEKISFHGKRADSIVKSMMQHSKQTEGVKDLTDINALCDEYLRLSYHGFRAKDKSFNADFKTDFDDSIEKVNFVLQDIGRVLLNLYNNAFYAVSEKAKKAVGLQKELTGTSNLSGRQAYVPTVTVVTKKLTNTIEIRVKDNGHGIPQNIVDKIFQPFFTTKPTGEGTGLGLSLSYDIIKAHGGEIKVETKQGEGSEFIMFLPDDK